MACPCPAADEGTTNRDRVRGRRSGCDPLATRHHLRSTDAGRSPGQRTAAFRISASRDPSRRPSERAGSHRVGPGEWRLRKRRPPLSWPGLVLPWILPRCDRRGSAIREWERRPFRTRPPLRWKRSRSKRGLRPPLAGVRRRGNHARRKSVGTGSFEPAS